MGNDGYGSLYWLVVMISKVYKCIKKSYTLQLITHQLYHNIATYNNEYHFSISKLCQKKKHRCSNTGAIQNISSGGTLKSTVILLHYQLLTLAAMKTKINARQLKSSKESKANLSLWKVKNNLHEAPWQSLKKVPKVTTCQLFSKRKNTLNFWIK